MRLSCITRSLNLFKVQLRNFKQNDMITFMFLKKVVVYDTRNNMNELGLGILNKGTGKSKMGL